MNSKHFEREINLIINEDLRMAVKCYMDDAVPEYFWTDGASSSGKYHPPVFAGSWRSGSTYESSGHVCGRTAPHE